MVSYLLVNFLDNWGFLKKQVQVWNHLLEIFKGVTPSQKDISTQNATSWWNNRTPSIHSITWKQSYSVRVMFWVLVDNNNGQNRMKAMCNEAKKKLWSNCWSMITKRHSWQTWNLKLKLQLNLRLRLPLVSDHLSLATSLLKYQKFASQITIYIWNLLWATTSHKQPWPLL